MGNERMELAVKYASEFGFKIIILHGISEKGGCTCSRGKTCQSAGKHPRYSEWQKWATTDVDKIRKDFKRYPNSNIGIATGGNFFVLDCDVKSGGDKSLTELENRHGLMRKTIRVITGGGGSHTYFLMPENTKIKTSAGVLPGIDIRSDGGLVVAPGSIHASGRKYEWVKGCSPLDIKMSPPDEWLVDKINIKKKYSRAPVVPETINSTIRNTTITSIAGTLRRRGLGRESIMAALASENDLKCDPPIDDRELEDIVNSIMKYDAADPATGLKWDKCMGVVLIDKLEALESPREVFAEDTISSLALARQENPAVYAKAKAMLKGKVNLNDLEKAVRHRQAAIKGLSVIMAKESREGIRFPGLEDYEFNIPDNWTVNLENGVTKTYTSKDGVEKTIVASFSPIVITRRFINLDNDSEKLELAFHRDGRWKRITASRAHIFNKNSLITLGNTGLPVSSNSAGELISYLEDFEAGNRDTAEVVKSLSRVGWTKDGEFFPFTTGDEIEFETDSAEAGQIYSALEPKGDYAYWKSECQKVRSVGAIPRFMVAASFASPLLYKLGRRTFIIHVWDFSRSGKSASLKMGVSVWGDPAKLIGSYNSTIVGLERFIGGLKHLPFGIDELQLLNEKRMPVESVMYSLAQEQGKTRGKRDGGLQDTMTWRNIVLSTGERPIIKESSQDGVLTRCHDLNGKVLKDEQLAAHVHSVVQEHFGYAGRDYLQRLEERIELKPDCIKHDFSKIRSQLLEVYELSEYLDDVVTVCLGDYYAGMFVWDADEETAFNEAIKMGFDILKNLNEHGHGNSVERAWDFFVGWILSNKRKFDYDASPRYGIHSNEDTWYVIPNYAHEALSSAGFDPQKSTRGFAEKGLIPTFKDSEGKNRTQLSKKINGVTCRVYVVKLDVDKEKDDDIPFLGE